jgi:tocopherol O-methyltransferase
LVELVADRLLLAPGQAVCDVGCGYGAPAAWLAEAHEVSVTGFTLSAAQGARAGRWQPARGALTVRVADWLTNGLPDAVFDRAYAIESTEHMADLGRCFAEVSRVLRPGGRLVVCAWLAAPAPQPWAIHQLLEPICREGRLAGLGTAADYASLLAEAGLHVESSEDISAAVARTWSVCIRRSLRQLATDRHTRHFLLVSRAADRVFAVTMIRLWLAFRTGAMRYGIITATKIG